MWVWGVGCVLFWWLSSTDECRLEWDRKWLVECRKLKWQVPFSDSAEQLRALLRTGLLKDHNTLRGTWLKSLKSRSSSLPPLRTPHAPHLHRCEEQPRPLLPCAPPARGARRTVSIAPNKKSQYSTVRHHPCTVGHLVQWRLAHPGRGAGRLCWTVHFMMNCSRRAHHPYSGPGFGIRFTVQFNIFLGTVQAWVVQRRSSCSRRCKSRVCWDASL